MVNVMTLLGSLLPKKKLDLVSDFDNSKHLCMGNRNSYFVLKGFWAMYLFLSSFMHAYFY